MDNIAVEEAALHLPETQRAELAHKLLLSLESQADASIAAMWRAEAVSRAGDIDSGAVQTLSANEVRDAAIKRLRRTFGSILQRRQNISIAWRFTKVERLVWVAITCWSSKPPCA